MMLGNDFSDNFYILCEEDVCVCMCEYVFVCFSHSISCFFLCWLQEKDLLQDRRPGP